MMFGKLGLVMIVVRDMERSVAFYRDVLGLKLLIHQDNWSQFDAGNILIGLHPEGDEVKVSPTTGMSIGIYVDDMDQAVAEIRRRFGKIADRPASAIRLAAGPWSSTRTDTAFRSSRWRAIFARSTNLPPQPERTLAERADAKSLRRGGGICNSGALILPTGSRADRDDDGGGLWCLGKRRHGCAQQQKTGQYGDQSISSTLFLQRTPLWSVHSIFLALCPHSFYGSSIFLV